MSKKTIQKIKSTVKAKKSQNMSFKRKLKRK